MIPRPGTTVLSGLAVACSLLVGPTAAQSQQIPTAVLTIDQGLPHAIVHALAQDASGFLWVGTSSGLARFDGSGFALFDESDGPHAIPPGAIRGLLVDSSDALWVAVEGGGFLRLGPERSGFERYGFEGDSILHDSFLDAESLLEDSAGRIWVGGEDTRVLVIDPSRTAARLLTLRPDERPAGRDHRISSLVEGPDGMIWAATFGGSLYSLEPRTLDPTLVSANLTGSAVPPAIRALHFDDQGLLWVGTTGGGVVVLDPSTGASRRIHAGGPPGMALSQNDVMALLPGDEGTLWAATYGGGLNRIDLRDWSVEWLVDRLEEPRLSALMRSRDGMIWIGTWGSGLNAFAPPMAGVTAFRPDDSALPGPDVTSVHRAGDGSFWLTLYDDGLHRLELHPDRIVPLPGQPLDGFTASPRLYTALETRSGEVYAGTWGLGLYRKTSPGSDFSVISGAWGGSGLIASLLEDRSGRLWVGTREGLGEVVAQGDSLVHIPLPFVDNQTDAPWIRTILEYPDGNILLGTSLGTAVLEPDTRQGRWLTGGPASAGLSGPTAQLSNVNSLAIDSAGSIWIGMDEGGVARIELIGDILTGPAPQVSQTLLSELPSANIEALALDDEGRLWISTGSGLTSYDPKTRVVRSLFEVDGVASNQGARGGLLWSDRTLIAASVDGLTLIRPDSLPPARAAPPVAVTGVRRLSDNVVTYDPLPGTRLAVPYRKGSLLVEFAVVELDGPAPPSYEYRLRSDEEWRPLGQTRTVVLGDNTPGDYELEVRAHTARGRVAHMLAPLQIAVVPPWWMTWWARLLGLSGFGGLILGLNRRRLARLSHHNDRLRAEIRSREIVEAERDALEEQFRRSQRLEAIGELTGGVAHDFNNILTVIQGNLELLAVNRPAERDIQDLTRECLRATGQASKLTQQLLSFSRKQILSAHRVDVGPLCENLMVLLRPSLGERFELSVEIDPDVGALHADAAHLESAILNLFLNSRDASPRGGPISLSVTRQTLTESQARELDAEGAEAHFESQSSAAFIRFAVRDQGQGMPHDVLTHAFDPFFTTKDPGKGTGLGLSMIYGFVRQSAGLLSISSEVGKGTTVAMYFPVDPPEGLEPPEAEEAGE